MGKPETIIVAPAPRRRDGVPHPVDVHVGAKVRAKRRELKMSQEALAQGVGITFQQVQKYERGANRVSASALVKIAQVMDVTPGWFVDDAPGAPGSVPASDDWVTAQRIVNSMPGALEGLFCLAAVSSPQRHALVAALQIAAGRWPDDHPKAAAA